MISKQLLEEAMYTAMKTAATRMPPDVRAALERVLAEETEPMARRHLEVSLQNADAAARGHGLVCADTGFPLFFVRVGSEARLEGGFASLQSCAARATARCTAECYLRPTMVNPLDRSNPGNNLGPGMPKVDVSFAESGDGIDLVAAPKGGGSEIFGTFYRAMFPSDGVAGIKKFVLSCLKDSCYAGKICPPAIIGVGIGGTADLCMRLAKEAAVLRPLGRRHVDPRVAALEEELHAASRRLGIGPMGSRGINAALAVHIETAVTHTASLPVAFNAQCLVGRRWRAVITAAGEVSYTGEMP